MILLSYLLDDGMFGRMAPQGTDNSYLFTCTVSYYQLRVFDNHAKNDSSLAFWSNSQLSSNAFDSCAITDNYVAVICGNGELSIMSYDGTSWQQAPVLSLDDIGLGYGTVVIGFIPVTSIYRTTSVPGTPLREHQI